MQITRRQYNYGAYLSNKLGWKYASYYTWNNRKYRTFCNHIDHMKIELKKREKGKEMENKKNIEFKESTEFKYNTVQTLNLRVRMLSSLLTNKYFTQSNLKWVSTEICKFTKEIENLQIELREENNKHKFAKVFKGIGGEAIDIDTDRF